MIKALLSRKTQFVLLFLLGVATTSVLAQERSISGKITSAEDGSGLPGVSVVVKGTTNGVITDFDGNYKLSVGEGSTHLVFSFIGMKTQEVEIGTQSVISLAMEEDALSLSEVIVTGYSTDARRETSGSVATLSPKSLKAAPSGNVEQQLQGRVAGVTVVTNGQPGTTSQIRVRGFGALGGNEPLYIVDGLPVPSTDFLSPDDIESTTVLKDATSASIYGARAAGGVIVYTTKKGKKEAKKMSVEYNAMFGVTTPGKSPEMLNPQEQADWTWKAIENAATAIGELPDYDHPQYGTGSTPVIPDYLLVGGATGVVGTVTLADHEASYNVDARLGPLYQVVKANKAGTDWYDETTRNAGLSRHHIGISGGGEGSRYYIGLGKQDQEGILLNQKFTRYTFRANSEFDLLPNLRLGENIQVTYRSARLLQGADGGSGSADDENFMLTTMRMSPIIPVYDEFGGWAGTSVKGFNNPENPVAELDGAKNNRAFYTQAQGNVYLELEPIENLVVRTSFGGQYQNFNSYNYIRQTYENSENNSSFGFNQFQNYVSRWTFTNTISYKKEFGGSKVGVLLGQEALNTGADRYLSASGINPLSRNTDYIQINTVGSQVVFGGHNNGANFASYFGRINYQLNDKYILSAVVRRDGSSKFGADNRYGIFPAFSGAWRLSSESFMSSLGWLDDMKIRGGYGIMGNSNNVDPNNQFSLSGTSISASSYDITGSNNGAYPGYYRTRIGNPAAQWEKAITTNVGLDVLLYDGKWDVVLDFWKRGTEGLLFQQPVSLQNGGFANSPSVNVGEMENKGIDLKIVNKGDITTDIAYEVTFNGSYLKNEIVALSEGITDLPNRSSSYRGITPVLNQVGYSLSSFYGYEVEGLFQNDAEVSAHATQSGAAPGRFRFKDQNGDGVIDIDDRTYLGSPVPKYFGGLNIGLTYKSFELDMYTSYSIGNKIYNMTKLFTDFYPLFPGAGISARAKDTWSTSNTSAEIPIFENTSNFSTNTQSNSYYVEDGSYLRMQNITVGYNLPASVLNKLKMSKLKIIGAVNNVFTITGYSGLDPSVGGSADTNFGVDLGNFPITRSWTLGISAGF